MCVWNFTSHHPIPFWRIRLNEKSYREVMFISWMCAWRMTLKCVQLDLIWIWFGFEEVHNFKPANNDKPDSICVTVGACIPYLSLQTIYSHQRIKGRELEVHILSWLRQADKNLTLILISGKAMYWSDWSGIGSLFLVGQFLNFNNTSLNFC